MESRCANIIEASWKDKTYRRVCKNQAHAGMIFCAGCLIKLNAPEKKQPVSVKHANQENEKVSV
jgi:hypothetical protein